MTQVIKGEKVVALHEMTDEFCNLINNYIKKNKLTFTEFCSRVRIDAYMLNKIMDRNIKMRAYRSLFFKIAEYIGLSSQEFIKLQPKDAL